MHHSGILGKQSNPNRTYTRYDRHNREKCEIERPLNEVGATNSQHTQQEHR